MKRFRPVALSLVVLTVLLIFGHPIWLPTLYTYLNVSQQPQPADVIVVLGGGDGQRERYAVQLYEHGYAPHVLASGHAETMGYAIKLIIEGGVPDSRLLINDEATSTYDEAQQVLNLLIEIDAQSALIVTDAFHTRRARATYQHVFSEHNIEITMVSPNSEIEPSTWWNSKYSKLVTAEYAKMLYYWIAYGVWSG